MTKKTLATEVDHLIEDRQNFQKIMIFPAKFSASKFIKDRRRIEGEIQAGTVRTANANLEILNFVKTVYLLKWHLLLSAEDTRNTARGDEIFLKYGTTYVFPKLHSDLSHK